MFTRVWNAGSVWRRLPVSHLHTQSPETLPCLLISELHHIFHLAIFSARIKKKHRHTHTKKKKTLHFFSSSDQLCLTETGARKVQLISPGHFLTFLQKAAETKRHRRASRANAHGHRRTERRERGSWEDGGEDGKGRAGSVVRTASRQAEEKTSSHKRKNQKKHRKGRQKGFSRQRPFDIISQNIWSKRMWTTELTRPG